jgi:hypothetical protein
MRIQFKKAAFKCCLFLSFSLNASCQVNQFRPLSSHDGEIMSVLITVPHMYHPRLSNFAVFQEADSILCSIAAKNWCIATRTQISLCKPISDQPALIDDLSNQDYGFATQFAELFNSVPKRTEVDFIGDIDLAFIKYTNETNSQLNFLKSDAMTTYFNDMVRWYKTLGELLNSQTFLTGTNSTDSLVYRPSCVPKEMQAANGVALGFGCSDLEVKIEQIPSWSQDEYVPQVNLNEFKLSSRYVPNGKQFGALNEQLSICDLNIDTSFEFDLDGGNYVVSGNYIFIGINVLKLKYQFQEGFSKRERLDVIHRLDKIGLDSTANEEDVNKKFQEKLGKNVIWVGGDLLWNYDRQFECSKDINGECGYQPMRHIDMFMHPISFGDGTLRMMVGFPDVKYNLFSLNRADNDIKQAGELAVALKGQIQDAVISMEKRLKEDNVALDTIVVPLPLLFSQPGNHIEFYYSFSNGLLSTSISKSIYYMPRYQLNRYVHNEKKLQYYSCVAQRSLRRFTEVELISAQFTWASAVRCRTLVTSRSTLTE